MIERKFWLLLAGLSAAAGLVQLPFAPARFGGVFFLALAVGCAGEWMMLRNRDKHRAFRVTAWAGRVLFALFLLSFAYIQIGVIGRGMHADPAAAEADYALVLGALVNPDGRPSAALAARCDTAADFLEAHPDAKAILCGGQGANEPRSEASAMFDYLVQKGVAPERLLKEDQSNNTIANIRNAREFLTDGDRCAVITNDYHVARARVLMRNAGLDPAGIPAPTPDPGQWVAVRCREYCSILGLMLSGRWW